MSDLHFTHLHLHTEYSLLDGANKIGKLAKKTKITRREVCGDYRPW